MGALNRDNYPMMVIYYLQENTRPPYLEFFKVKKLQIWRPVKLRAVAIISFQRRLTRTSYVCPCAGTCGCTLPLCGVFQLRNMRTLFGPAFCNDPFVAYFCIYGDPLQQ